MNEAGVEKAVAALLAEITEDANDPHFTETPKRWAKAYKELLRGQWSDPPNLKVFPRDEGAYTTPEEPPPIVSGMIFKGPLAAVSMCPHHVLPYTIEGWFAYYPKTTVVGISKPGRLLEWCCARMVVQESLAPMFLNRFTEAVNPAGAILLLRGHHSCEQLRGAKQRSSVTTTYAATGNMRGEKASRNFLRLIALEEGRSL